MSFGLKLVWRAEMDDEGVCLLRIFERVLRNLRRRRCGSMVGRDGRNLLRVKKRCVDSLSSAPPRAKYLLLLIFYVRVLGKYGGGGIRLGRNSKQSGRSQSPVESRNKVETEREKSQAHDPGAVRCLGLLY